MVTTLTQKKGWVWKRLRHCPPKPKKPEYEQAKQADWLMLQLWAESGLICLKYVDESGFERCSTLNYSYSRRGEQKRIHQPPKRGKRISALGIWQPQHHFDYGARYGGIQLDGASSSLWSGRLKKQLTISLLLVKLLWLSLIMPLFTKVKSCGSIGNIGNNKVYSYSFFHHIRHK